MTAGGYVIAPAARSDILAIADYIAQDNPDAALRMRNDLFAAFERLGQHPGIGHRRRDLTSLPVRFWTVRGRYMIVYRGEKRPIEILRVLSAYRDIAGILAQEKPDDVSAPDKGAK